MLETIEKRFRKVAPAADFCSLRLVDERSESIRVRQDVLQPVAEHADLGAMITVIDGDGLGYAATSDLTEAGLARTAAEASAWAKRTQGRGVVDFTRIRMPRPKGEYATPVTLPWDAVPLADKIDLLRGECRRLKVDDRIVDWECGLWNRRVEQLFLTADGGRVHQQFHFVIPSMSATANEGAESQTRTNGGGHRGFGRQGGMEVLDRIGFREMAPQLAGEALALLAAPNCPSGRMDVLLDPGQMALQIHESIGHPLELDRILGDERNYAGTSFVTLDMLGSFRYGSELLNITYDPTRREEYASFGFDDDGLEARKEFLIQDGILLRPLGGIVSQQRAGVAGVANSRACSWNRPPIDRMANLNLEAGTSTLEEMVAAIERGVYMKTNLSWSIDDSRNKFQFGCEWGRLIENGRLTTVVKSPNYRGISRDFWRSLKMVGREELVEVQGTPFCGKGEPNQVIHVGHASPPCVFTDVDVFGGE